MTTLLAVFGTLALIAVLLIAVVLTRSGARTRHTDGQRIENEVRRQAQEDARASSDSFPAHHSVPALGDSPSGRSRRGQSLA
ncbi:hypothetical protein [Streptomyces zingiberis]|uniref:Uncharacterized protein n=1 Tax=Streptomyces zingiberis TaxID=2053010 RepID=A0ABX1BXW1_9ACTN|nr:hypothetical protein [Streptomyces zingiberis]NJQ00144.1 hypothetical protein [Streptomyces zingiberis]